MTPHRLYLYASLAGIGAFFFLPADSWWRAGWCVAIGAGAAGAIVAGVRAHRPPARAAWLLFAIGIVLNAGGSMAEAVVSRVFAIDAFPGAPDAFYLALYPALAAGMVLLVRGRGDARDWGALVDSATVTTGLGLLAWVFMIRPAATDPTIGLFGHIVSVAYPIGDVVLIALLARLVLGRGIANRSYLFMTASLGLFLFGDAVWAVSNHIGWVPGTTVQSLLGMNFLLAYVCFGAAGLHPSVGEVGTPAPVSESKLSMRQLAFLSAVSLIAPGLLALQVAGGEVTDGVAIVVGCVVLFLLVVTRMAQLVRRVEAQAVQLRNLARVDDLTGLPNRRAWSSELPRAMERARRDATPLTIALFDLDHFKRFNDRFGHPAGDRLLKGASAAWRSHLRVGDELVRYGGEEFAVLLPDANGDEASQVVDRMRAVTPLDQTFSAGIVTWDGTETSDELVARADEALYAAKHTGRDRIVLVAA